MNESKRKRNNKKENKKTGMTYIHNFQVVTDMPWLTEQGVEHALVSNSLGYNYKVAELKLFK